MKVPDGYEVLEVLSRRGQTETVRARTSDGKLVVLKIFEGLDDFARDALTDRARALASLDHPGLAKCHGLIDTEHGCALIYDWIEGKTAAQLIETGQRYDDVEVYDMMSQTLQAVSYMHDRDVIHRDIKPQNVVFDGARWVLIDFGAARETLADSGTTSVIGTTGYAAPEQFLGRSEKRSDQYGIAATALHATTHRHPTDFPLAGLRVDLASTHLSTPLRAILAKMMEPDPGRRYESTSDALEAVERAQNIRPWENALARIENMDTIVETRSTPDKLIIEIGTRGEIRKIMRALGKVFLCILTMIAGYELQFLDDNFLVSIVSYMFIYAPILYGVFVLQKLHQLLRDRDPSTIVITRDRWQLKAGERSLKGLGKPPLRIGKRSSASTSGYGGFGFHQATGSVRTSLVLEGKRDEVEFASGLMPIEAEAILAAIDAFEPQELEFDFDALRDDEEARESVEAEARVEEQSV